MVKMIDCFWYFVITFTAFACLGHLWMHQQEYINDIYHALKMGGLL
jgi:hypothetical protein